MQFSRCGTVSLLLVLLSIFQLHAGSDIQSPSKVVYYLFRSAKIHFGFDADIVKNYKPWLTPDLYARIEKKANAPVPKGDAPDIEGDLFLDSQEPPTSFEVGKESIDKTTAKVPVTLTWPSEKRQETVLLKQVDGAWKVYDVDFGKDGKLTDLL